MAESRPKLPRFHIISRRMIREFLATVSDPSAESAFDDWYLNARDAQWGSFADVKATYADASWVGGLVVFNVGGNIDRIATRIDFEARMIFMLFVGTHREYDKGKWKG
jgi:mRNA interferase HigB